MCHGEEKPYCPPKLERGGRSRSRVWLKIEGTGTAWLPKWGTSKQRLREGTKPRSRQQDVLPGCRRCRGDEGTGR